MVHSSHNLIIHIHLLYFHDLSDHWHANWQASSSNVANDNFIYKRNTLFAEVQHQSLTQSMSSECNVICGWSLHHIKDAMTLKPPIQKLT
jgi:hypothetical protein